PLHKSTQQVRTQGPIRHADCRQRKLADFLCTGGIIQGLIRRGKRRIRHWLGQTTTSLILRVQHIVHIHAGAEFKSISERVVM
ncbi:hypothetical protein FV311_13785, partial [Escherichia coli]